MARPKKIVVEPEAKQEKAEIKETVVVEKKVEAAAETPKIKVKRDWSKKGMLDVPPEVSKKYPGMHFVWSVRTESKLKEKEDLGYTYPTILKDSRKTGRGTGEETSYITHNDLILMMIPEEDYQDRVQFNADAARARVAALEKTAGNRDGIRKLHSSLIVEESLQDS